MTELETAEPAGAGGAASRQFGGRRSHAALAWVGALVSIVFAYLAVRDVRWPDVWDGLRTMNYWWLLPGFAALVLSVYVKALRWRYLFSAETRPATWPAARAMLIGYFFNGILPARAGEAARVVALNKQAGTSMTETAATVVVERVYDVLALLLLLFLVVPWLPAVTWIHGAVVLAVVLVALFVVAIVVLALFGVRPVHAVLRPLARLPFLSAERVESIGNSLVRGLAALRRPRLIAGAFAWTALAWLSVALSFWFVMEGFGLGLSLVAALLVIVATNLVQILPSSPSALGVFEAATLVALRAYGVDDSTALSYALVVHALHAIPFIVAGLALFGPSVRWWRRPPSEAQSA